MKVSSGVPELIKPKVRPQGSCTFIGNLSTFLNMDPHVCLSTGSGSQGGKKMLLHRA